MDTKTVTIAQAAEILEVSSETVRRWLNDGTLSGYKTHPDKRTSPYRVEIASIEAILEKRKRQLDQS